jgi:hypothetical protein
VGYVAYYSFHRHDDLALKEVYASCDHDYCDVVLVVLHEVCDVAHYGVALDVFGLLG